jgi:hypothetical protein
VANDEFTSALPGQELPCLGQETKKCLKNQATGGGSWLRKLRSFTSNPGQASTGRRGYRSKRTSVLERSQRKNVLLRELVIIVA